MKVNVMRSISLNTSFNHPWYPLQKRLTIAVQCQFPRQTPPRNIVQENKFINLLFYFLPLTLI